MKLVLNDGTEIPLETIKTSELTEKDVVVLDIKEPLPSNAIKSAIGAISKIFGCSIVVAPLEMDLKIIRNNIDLDETITNRCNKCLTVVENLDSKWCPKCGLTNKQSKNNQWWFEKKTYRANDRNITEDTVNVEPVEMTGPDVNPDTVE